MLAANSSKLFHHTEEMYDTVKDYHT